MNNHESLLVHVAQLYYQQNLNQSEISKIVGLSRPTVSRMLEEAREVGIVEIIVQNFPSITYPHCIFRLKFYYKLPSFIVKPEFAVRLFLYPYTSLPLFVL